MENLDELIKDLGQTQFQTKNHKNFEKCLAKAFNAIGFKAKHLGGRNDPDILIEHKGDKVTVDAKTCRQNSAVTEQMIGFPAQKRYREKYQSDKSAVIAPRFTSGNVQKTANELGVILISTAAVLKILRNHKYYPYSTDVIFNMLFNGGNMITPEHIKSSLTEDKKIIIEILRNFFAIMEKKDIGEFTVQRIQDIFTGKDKDYQNEDIKIALELLKRLNILTERNEKYKLTRDIREILNDIKIIGIAIGSTDFEENQKIESETFSSFPSELSKKLKHVLAVIKLMKSGLDHKEAVKKVANQFNVTQSTINDQCARSLGLGSVSEFREYYREGKLKKFLIQKFPGNEAVIEEAFK